MREKVDAGALLIQKIYRNHPRFVRVMLANKSNAAEKLSATKTDLNYFLYATTDREYSIGIKKSGQAKL
ncbi:MAG: hypothetical protein ACRC62_34420 [Microcoleus sp.]